MIKYLKMSFFVLLVFATLGLAIAPSLLVFLYPQDNMAFNIVLFYFIYFFVIAVLSPLLVGLYAMLAKKLLPARLSDIIAPKEANEPEDQNIQDAVDFINKLDIKLEKEIVENIVSEEPLVSNEEKEFQELLEQEQQEQE